MNKFEFKQGENLGNQNGFKKGEPSWNKGLHPGYMQGENNQLRKYKQNMTQAQKEEDYKKVSTTMKKRWENPTPAMVKQLYNFMSAGEQSRFEENQDPWNKGLESPKFKGENNPKWNGGKREVVCPSCGDPVLAWRYQLHDYNGALSKCCSRKCADSWVKMSGVRSGPNNAAWKGGPSIEGQEQRRSFEYAKVRRLVLFRDNYVCALCNVRGGLLHVDHIKKWAEFPELRFTLENCRTLCRECHFFVTFGYKIPKDSKWGLNVKNFVFKKNIDEKPT